MELTLNLDNIGTSTSTKTLPLPAVLGFFFAFRLCITFLWFQADPVAGSAASILLGLMLLATTIFAGGGNNTTIPRTAIPSTVKWIIALLSYAALSLAWSVTPSYLAAIADWLALAADVAMVWLVLRDRDHARAVASILKGFVWGACIVATIAWVIPPAEDLRLGNEVFLHPNALGWQFATATLFAQHLSRRQPAWKWLALALAVTLLRTLSKTSIAAFAIAEIFYVLHDSRMGRTARLQIGLVAAAVIVTFWGLLENYADLYTTQGSSPETLTGRTVLWTVTLSMALDRPWLGYGLHSFEATIPALGRFEPGHAHNEFLHQFFVYGILGVLLICGIYLSFYRNSRRASRSDLRTLALALLIMALVRGLADTEKYDLSFPFWLLTLLSVSLAPPSLPARSNHD